MYTSSRSYEWTSIYAGKQYIICLFCWYNSHGNPILTCSSENWNSSPLTCKLLHTQIMTENCRNYCVFFVSNKNVDKTRVSILQCLAIAIILDHKMAILPTAIVLHFQTKFTVRLTIQCTKICLYLISYRQLPLLIHNVGTRSKLKMKIVLMY